MSNNFTYKAEEKGNSLVISTDGYLNKEAGEMVAEECFKHIDNGTKKVILNMEKTKVINSIGISILIEIIEKLQSVNGKMVFTNLDSAVDKTLTIMGLFQLTDKAATVDEAIKA